MQLNWYSQAPSPCAQGAVCKVQKSNTHIWDIWKCGSAENFPLVCSLHGGKVQRPFWKAGSAWQEISLTRKIPETLSLIVSRSLPWGPAHIRFVCQGSQVLSNLFIQASQSSNCWVWWSRWCPKLYNMLIHTQKHTSTHTSEFLPRHMIVSQSIWSCMAWKLVLYYNPDFYPNRIRMPLIEKFKWTLQGWDLVICILSLTASTCSCGHISLFHQQMHLPTALLSSASELDS